MQVGLITILLCILGMRAAADLSCNGSPEFCDLRFDQFTFSGSHSAGSGFDGPPRDCDGSEANSCVFRNQNLSITEQLNLGIRYLSLDVCFLADTCNTSNYGDLGISRLVSCQGSSTDIRFGGYAFGGSLVRILRQVDDWMRKNTDEVIGIHFTSNIPEEDRGIVFSNLVPLLEMMWGEGTTNWSNNSVSATEMSTFYSSNSNTWPTLREAVKMNRRIFIFVDDDLNTNGVVRPPWINAVPFSTLESQGWSPTCENPGVIDHASRCNITAGSEELVIAIGYTLAVCITNGQESCNRILQNATEICYGFRQEDNRTVNILLVDYPNIGMGPNSVFEIVTVLNQRNVLQYVGDRLTTTTKDNATTTEDIVPTCNSAMNLPSSFYVTALFSSFVLSCHFVGSFMPC